MYLSRMVSSRATRWQGGWLLTASCSSVPSMHNGVQSIPATYQWFQIHFKYHIIAIMLVSVFRTSWPEEKWKIWTAGWEYSNLYISPFYSVPYSPLWVVLPLLFWYSDIESYGAGEYMQILAPIIRCTIKAFIGAKSSDFGGIWDAIIFAWSETGDFCWYLPDCHGKGSRSSGAEESLKP